MNSIEVHEKDLQEEIIVIYEYPSKKSSIGNKLLSEKYLQEGTIGQSGVSWLGQIIWLDPRVRLSVWAE